MASVATFTPSQRRKIDHFKSITNIQSDEIAHYALQKTNWDVTNCISLYFENPDALLRNNINTNTNNIARQNANNIANNNNNNNQQSSIGYYASYIPGLTSLGSLISSMFSYLTPYLPYVTSIFSIFGMNTTSVPYNEILKEYKEKYNDNTNGNIFINKRFGEIMQMISESYNDNKCIFIYFNDINSTLCDRFIRNILYDKSVIEYLSVNMISFLGDNRNIEGRQLFNQITHQFRDKRKPFVCIAGIHPISKKLVLVHRQYVGNCGSSMVFIANVLDHGLQRWQQFKLKQIEQQQLSSSNRYLREMQDREYQKALLEKQQQQEIINNNNTSIQDEKIDNFNNINNNIQNDEKNDINNERYFMDRMNMAKDRINKLELKGNKIRVALRLPNGDRIEHQFCESDLVDSLFDLALCNVLKIDGKWIDEFELVCSYPKKIFSDADKWKTLKDVGIERSALLHVQEKDI